MEWYKLKYSMTRGQGMIWHKVTWCELTWNDDMTMHDLIWHENNRPRLTGMTWKNTSYCTLFCIRYVCNTILGYFPFSSQNCFTSTLDYIDGKSTHEKGYWDNTTQDNVKWYKLKLSGWQKVMEHDRLEMA